MSQTIARRSRRLAGLPPISDDEDSSTATSTQEEVLYKTEEYDNGLIYTDHTRIEYAWLTFIVIFILIPFYLFLSSK